MGYRQKPQEHRNHRDVLEGPGHWNDLMTLGVLEDRIHPHQQAGEADRRHPNHQDAEAREPLGLPRLPHHRVAWVEPAASVR